MAILQSTLQPKTKTHSNGQMKNGKKNIGNGHLAPAPKVLPDYVQGETILEGVRQKVFQDRYSLKDEEGNPTERYTEQMWYRVAWGIAQEEKTPELRKYWTEKFYKAMEDFKFVPAGRILSGAGTGYQVTFFNCYVIPSPKDSRKGIMENITHTVEIQARGGGVGVNLSSLRPSGARVKKVNGTSSGPVNWAALYSTANHDVIQQGGSRRGALMLMLHDWHPDVVKFIKAKEDGQSIPGANLSVCISDRFMEAVKNDGEWETKFPDTQDPDYDDLWDGDIEEWEKLGKKVIIYETFKAREMWDMICFGAWKAAEPGLHFLDRSNKWSNTWYFEKLVSTNPCGEQPLGDWAVCNLGAVNLGYFVKDGQFDFEQLDQTIRVAMRFMDNVVDANYYFLEENEVAAKNIRRTGIGTMGLADALIKLRLKYGSDEAMPVIEKIYRTIRDAAYEVSSDLAEEKGSFPKFDRDKYAQGNFIKQLPQFIQDKIKKQGIRNAVILTQAPTGTTALLAGASSGIEPVFDFSYTLKTRIGVHTVYHPLFQTWKDEHADSSEIPGYFVNANQLTPMEHIKVQAQVQKYTDSSISKTANAPFGHTINEVKELYMAAYDLGCKGVTYFRDGSRSGTLYHEEEEKKEQPQLENGDAFLHRPMILMGRTYKMNTPVGEAFVTVNRDDMDQPFEVFVNIGKGGMHTMADAEAMGRLVSLCLRIAAKTPNSRAVAEKIIAQLRGIGASNQVGFGKERVMSLADAIAKVLAEDLHHTPKTGEMEQVPLNLTLEPPVLTNGEMKSQSINNEQLTTNKQKDLCPECGNASFAYEEGCKKCYSCGYSMC